jgi:hypothetical protein
MLIAILRNMAHLHFSRKQFLRFLAAEQLHWVVMYYAAIIVAQRQFPITLADIAIAQNVKPPNNCAGLWREKQSFCLYRIFMSSLPCLMS